jgi:hypothetical protein
MRKTAMLTAVTMLLGGCTGLMGPMRSETPAEPVPRPVPARAEPTVAEAQAPAPRQTRATPPRQQEIRIDNSSIDSFRASWQRLRATLSPMQQSDLNDAVVRLAFASYGGASDVPANLRNSPVVPETIRHRIAGLTYAEILALPP